MTKKSKRKVASKKADRTKEILAKRTDVICDCKHQQQMEKDRAKYGVCRCDSFSFCHTVGIILANALFQYVADASRAIIREDFELIEKHAQAIKDYAETDSWDQMATTEIDGKSPTTRIIEYNQKEHAFREAMFWLTQNWQGLWW